MLNTHSSPASSPLPSLCAASGEIHLSISISNIHYIPQPLTSLLIRPTHSKLAAAITGNIKHGLCWAPSDRYHTDHRQTPTVIGIITVGNDHTPSQVGAQNPTVSTHLFEVCSNMLRLTGRRVRAHAGRCARAQ